MQKIAIIGILVAATLGIGLLVQSSNVFNSTAHAQSAPPAKKPPTPVSVVCPPENVQHWDKIMFTSALDPATNTIIRSTDPAKPDIVFGEPYDIKVLDNPAEIAEVKDKVIQFLSAKGFGFFELLTGDSKPLATGDVAILDIEYAIVCAAPQVEPIPPP